MIRNRVRYRITISIYIFILTGILYVAPEMHNNNNNNATRRMDQKWVEQSQDRRRFDMFRREEMRDHRSIVFRAGDIYAFGIVIYEILFRRMPFNEKLDMDGQSNYSKDQLQYIYLVYSYSYSNSIFRIGNKSDSRRENSSTRSTKGSSDTS